VPRHILLTNDFPPKVGGIQSYLWELWRRLPPEDVTVLTASYPGGDWWDRDQKFRIVRAREPILLPQPHLAHRVRELARSVGAKAVVIDPAVPLGLLGPSLGLPYAVVLHGAEVTVPGRLPFSRQLLARALSHASLWVAAGTYPENEARRAIGQSLVGEAVPHGAGVAGGVPPSVQVPPGVDTERFKPLSPIEKAAARARLGLPVAGPLVASVSRLVPRKGMDTLIRAAELAQARLGRPGSGLSVAIGGTGRDRHRLERIASKSSVPVRLLGQVGEADLPDLYACADVFALCCRSRWWGLEQEGFGIVLVEAAAAGVPCITIGSGGAAEAVIDGETGIVVPEGDGHGEKGPAVAEGGGHGEKGPAVAKGGGHGEKGPAVAKGGGHGESRTLQVEGVADAIVGLVSNPARARAMGEAGRRRAEDQLSYDILAANLGQALERLPETAGEAGSASRRPSGGLKDWAHRRRGR